jgi:alanine racemase
MSNQNSGKKIGFRPTWAEVDLRNLAYNFRQVKGKLSYGVKIMACVKADAYGHGLIPVAKTLTACGVDYFSVASIDEAIKLREAKIKSPILVLGMILKEDIAPLFRYNITQTVCNRELARSLNDMARRKGVAANVHIKIDTGMGRIGVLHDEAIEFVKQISRLKYINVEGIFTHLACADVNPRFTAYQIGLFENLLSELERCGIKPECIHTANSLGIAKYSQSHFNMVRPGLVLYGLSPEADFKLELKPVMSLKTRVVYVKKLPRGWGISYGHTYVTASDTYVATLPIGYGDGYPRNLSNLAPVIIRGKLLKISGMVCMDQIMIDTGTFQAKTGDEVVLIGAQGEEKITTEELAGLSGTIPYEIVCGIGSRVPRVYR